MKMLFTLPVLALLLAPPAAAGKHEVRRSLEASPTGLVDIELFDGSVSIEGWDQGEVQVVAILARGDDEIDLERTGNSLQVEVESRHPGNSRASLEIKVPRGSSVRIEVMSAGVDVVGVDGEIDIEAVAGSITIEGKPRKVRAQTVTGAITLATTGSERIGLETVSGSLTAEGEAKNADASTVAGPLKLRLRGVSNGHFETVSGSLDAEILPAPGGRFGFESFSGEMLLAVPANVSGSFELESHSGRVSSGLATAGDRRDDGGLEFELGGGEASFRLESYSGEIEVRAIPRQ